MSHEKVQKRELMPKNAEKLKFLMRCVEIFNIPVLKEIVEKLFLKKFDLNCYFYGKKIKNDVFLERTFFFQPCYYVIIHFEYSRKYAPKNSMKNSLKKLLTQWDNPFNLPITAGVSFTRVIDPCQSSRFWVVNEPS